MDFFLILFLVAIAAALALYWLSSRERARPGLPFNARMVYADTGAWEKVEKPLYSKQYGLAGKPDYIVEHPGTARQGKWDGSIIPVEVKPSRAAPQPRESDVMQLAAYALLVEETLAKRVSHGLLKYRDQIFQIEFTAELRAGLIALMDEMRIDVDVTDVPRSHNVERRCRRCSYRTECGEEL